MLGVMDYKVPGIAGGSRARAREELNQALAMDSHNPFTHYYLAEFYKVTGDFDPARAELKTLQALQVPADSIPELQLMQRKGEKLLDELH